MSRVSEALRSAHWLIYDDAYWLPLMEAIAERDLSPEQLAAAGVWQKRDYDLMAGPAAQRLAGAQRAYVIDGVAVLPITGPIFPRGNMMTEISGATSVTMLQNDYSAALKNGDVGAIMLLIDSPGGAVPGIAAFADAVAAGNKTKPTVAHVAGTGASAAYWIGSQAGELVVERTAMVGSIGVAAAMSKQVAPDRDGNVDVEIVSSNAPNKRPDPQSEVGADAVRETLDAIESHFIGDVAKGRKTTAAKVKSDFGQGGVKVGAAAVTAGMADKVQSYETTLSGMRRQVANQRKLAALKR
jgi:ClpP class serine protease